MYPKKLVTNNELWLKHRQWPEKFKQQLLHVVSNELGLSAISVCLGSSVTKWFAIEYLKKALEIPQKFCYLYLRPWAQISCATQTNFFCKLQPKVENVISRTTNNKVFWRNQTIFSLY